MTNGEYTEKQKRFEELNQKAKDICIESIIKHFEGDSWTVHQLEDIWGENVINTEGMTEEQISAYDNFVSLNKALDKAELENLLRTNTDFDFGTLLLYADNEFHTDLKDLVIPYKIVILQETDEHPLTDWDEVELMLADEDDLSADNIKEYVICYGKQDLIEKWEDLLKQNEGAWYGVKDDSGLIVGGAYDPNDIENLEELYEEKPSYIFGNSFITTSEMVNEEQTNELVLGVMAMKWAKNLDRGFGCCAKLLDADGKQRENNPFVIGKKDPSLEGVYELWIRTGCDDNGNGGKVAGKIYDLCGTKELAKALYEIDKETAVLTTENGRKNIKDVLEEYEHKDIER